MGDDDFSRGRREHLRIDLDHLKDTLTKTLESYTETVQSYSDLMQKALIENPYFDHSDFLKLHQNSKTTAIEPFQSQHNGDNKLSSVVQRKIEANIEQKMPPLEAGNEAKRQDFLKRANLHSETVSRELKASSENRVRAGIGGSFLSDHDFVNLFLNMKSTILQEFASRKMGDDELSTQAHQFYRKELEGSIDNLRIVLKQANEAHRPPREPSNWVQFRDSIRRGLGIIH
ncbi:uncharacterized protein LOC129568529 [Sitodiplosis mosellana]|uniref:uncharacterized protein LOC129568529 n=1 Tax=Sitodiplosis mosellana TaxID=263140 RepID=UPI002443979E|nr:uncharacterized protein LOC129568529 [Sitodiplosis mosellana]